jgi:hypothetical protein
VQSTLLAAVILSLSAAVPATAHHSIAAFDMTREATISGTVMKFYWANPHAYIYLDVEAPDAVQHWAVEIESPNLLRHHGWTRETLKAGGKITCKGARARDPQNFTMKCFTVVLPDGSTLQAQ